jgi:hypothetical protein
MDKVLQALSRFVTQLTWMRVLMLATVVTIGVGGYGGYAHIQRQQLQPQLLGGSNLAPVAIDITDESRVIVAEFMRKYPQINYITLLKMDFGHNIRTPILRMFNDKELEAFVYKKLDGGDGSLPIFLRDDAKNNNQMITIIQGGLVCDEFANGGLARVWPELIGKLKWSCRVTIPPAYSLIRGYIVIHLAEVPRAYEAETLQRDLAQLSQKLYDIDVSRQPGYGETRSAP